MLSGIGPADQLRAHGIAPRTICPASAATCRTISTSARCVRSTQPVTYDQHQRRRGRAPVFLLRRSGLGTSNIAEAGGFVRSRLAPDARRDMQFHFVPALLDEHGRHRLDGYGYTLHACALRPKSRGTIRAQVAPIRDACRAIEPNYLGDADGHDLRCCSKARAVARDLRAAARSRRIAARRSSRRDVVATTRTSRLRAAQGRDDLSPGRHLPHGQRRGSPSSTASCACAARGPARRRCVGHADADRRQHECADDDDRGARSRVARA